MAHVEKYTKNDIVGLAIHYERREGCELSNQDIDKSKSLLNYNLSQQLQPLRPEEFISKRLKEVKHINRKDIIVMVDWIVTLPKNVKKEDEEKFFDTVYEFMKKEYGEKNIVGAWVHKDEKTPHIHLGFIPVINDNGIERLNCKKLITRSYLKQFHNRLSDYVEPILGYQTEILNGATINGNRSIKELKNQEDISLQKAKQNIRNHIANTNKILTQAENIEYDGSFVTKLKSLSQANKSIEELTISNKTLQQDNNKLLNLIDIQKQEIDMYREMPLAKQVKQKEEVIQNLYSSINHLEKTIEDNQYEFQRLRYSYDQIDHQKEKLEQENYIYKLFIDTFKLKNIFKEFKTIILNNDFSIRLKQLKDLCSKMIHNVSLLVNKYEHHDIDSNMNVEHHRNNHHDLQL